MPNRTDQDFVERAATRHLEFRGFVSSEGICNRCGKVPDGTGCLHVVYDPQDKKLLQYGVYCFPAYLVPALRRAIAVERNPSRREMMEKNLNKIPPRRKGSRCNVTKIERTESQKDISAPPEQCIGGAYDFVIQAIGQKTFTLRVYDDELPLLGEALMRDEGKSEDVIAGMKNHLAEVARAFCCTWLSKTQDKENCRILRFSIGRLTNRRGGKRGTAGSPDWT